MEFVLASLKDLKKVVYAMQKNMADINKELTSIAKQMKTHNACNGHGGKGALRGVILERFVQVGIPCVSITLCLIALQWSGATEFTAELAETAVSALNP